LSTPTFQAEQVGRQGRILAQATCQSPESHAAKADVNEFADLQLPLVAVARVEVRPERLEIERHVAGSVCPVDNRREAGVARARRTISSTGRSRPVSEVMCDA